MEFNITLNTAEFINAYKSARFHKRKIIYISFAIYFSIMVIVAGILIFIDKSAFKEISEYIIGLMILFILYKFLSQKKLNNQLEMFSSMFTDGKCFTKLIFDEKNLVVEILNPEKKLSESYTSLGVCLNTSTQLVILGDNMFIIPKSQIKNEEVNNIINLLDNKAIRIVNRK